MGGGLLQLVAYGAQDAYLTGNPQITFWKAMFKRHTNFAMEPFRINFSGQAAWGTKQTAIIGRHADLLFSTYLQVELPYFGHDGKTPYAYNNDQGALGLNLIKYTELDIGGQIIDRLYSEWMWVWGSLTKDQTQTTKWLDLLGGNAISGSTASLVKYLPGCAKDGRQYSPNIFYVPLPFFFTKNAGAALPLIALQYHEVKINIYWNEPEMIAGNFTSQTLTDTTTIRPPISQLPSPVNAAIYIDYIYLDTEERRRMAQASHEYLIEQTQYNEEKGIVGASNRIDLTFNHPVKELVWVVQPNAYTNCRIATESGYNRDSTTPIASPALGVPSRLTPFTYTNESPVYEQWLQINGQDRMDRRYGDYFSRVQAFQHHSGNAGAGVYSYSFALKPEEHQPSGTCNFSRIDTATIVMNMAGQAAGPIGTATNPNFGANPDFDNWDVRVYAVNYNILRVMSGMAGLAYSN
jgi:hypothetical protein